MPEKLCVFKGFAYMFQIEVFDIASNHKSLQILLLNCNKGSRYISFETVTNLTNITCFLNSFCFKVMFLNFCILSQKSNAVQQFSIFFFSKLKLYSLN